jgi:DNA-binding transcriptional MerR regulator
MLPEIPDKLFFRIGEVAEIVGVEQHVLRYWEDEFDVLKPDKNQAGQRLYRRKDIEMVIRIKELLYEEMFTIAGAKKKLKTKKRDPSQLSFHFDPDEFLKWKKQLKSDLNSVIKLLDER